MDNPDTLDSLFLEAVTAIDGGDITTLERLLAAHPRLVRERLDSPGPWLREKVGNALDGFFRQPYLLWFVAEDPVRNNKLPRNIAQVTRAIIRAAEREGVDNLQEQLDYALRLVSWSWVARKCEVQIEQIDVLIDAGAALGVDLNLPCADLYSHATALHHAVSSGSLEAVKVLVEAGAVLNTKDSAWNATPLGWAEYYMAEPKGDETRKSYREIAAYLRSQEQR